MRYLLVVRDVTVRTYQFVGAAKPKVGRRRLRKGMVLRVLTSYDSNDLFELRGAEWATIPRDAWVNVLPTPSAN
jgi:hypothetical protein